ncbi:MAG TPA: ThuA domain-containing protein, partial [Verrucomicrobiae bacterium]
MKQTQLYDLTTFLLNEPPKRTPAEIQAILKAEPNEAKPQLHPLNIVLVASKQDHGSGQHDYPAWQKRWLELLGRAPQVNVSEAWEWPSAAQFSNANLLVFYFWNHQWSLERYAQLDVFLERGGGAAFFHAGVIADKEPEQLASRIGLAAQPGPTKYLHTPFALEFKSPNSALTRGFTTLHLLDEPYWPMFGDTNRVQILASTIIEGQSHPMLWTFQKGKGRV